MYDKICLVIPPSVFLLDERVFPFLGILKVAAMLEILGYRVDVLDLSGVENYVEVVYEHATNSDIQLYGITATTAQIPAADNIGTALKILGKKVLLGGTHATLANAGAKKGRNDRAKNELRRLLRKYDHVVCGDGELAIGHIMKRGEDLIDADDPKSLLFLKKDALDLYPFPARHLIDLNSYHYTIDGEVSTSLISQLGCPFGCTFCNLPDNLILTKKGMLTAKDLYKSFNTELFTGYSWKKITNKFERYVKEDIYKIKPQGLFEFGLTKDHEVNTKRGWIKAENLNKDDEVFIGVPKETEDIKFLDIYNVLKNKDFGYHRSGGNRRMNASYEEVVELLDKGYSNLGIQKVIGVNRKTVKKIKEGTHGNKTAYPVKLMEKNGFVRLTGTKNSVKRFIKFDNEFCELVGYFIAEGHVCFQKNGNNSATVGFTFSIDETEYINRVVYLIKHVFDVEAKVSCTNTAVQICISSSIIGLFFKELFGKSAKEKKLPMEWFSLPTQKLRFIMKSYINGDGYRDYNLTSGHYRYKCTTVSKQLAWQLVLLGYMFGFSSHIFNRNKTEYIQGRKVNAISSFCVELAGKEALIDFENNQIQRQEGIWKKLSYIKKEFYEGKVYNFEIKDEPFYTANLTQIHNCAGRNSAFLRTARIRSTESIIAELRFLYNTYGYKGYMFYDDELNVNPQFPELMRSILELSDELGVKFKLRGFLKAELFTEEQARLMKEAGFSWLLTGFESGSERILTNINKRATRDDNTRAVEYAKKYGLKVKALMSVGHAGETFDTAWQTMDWLLEVQPEDFDLTVITPYPGSPYYDDAVRSGEDFVYTHSKTGDKLYMDDIDYRSQANYYKGIPGEYSAFVWTDELSKEDIVTIRETVENDVRENLDIPFNLSGQTKRVEVVNGLPDNVLRKNYEVDQSLIKHQKNIN